VKQEAMMLLKIEYFPKHCFYFRIPLYVKITKETEHLQFQTLGLPKNIKNTR